MDPKQTLSEIVTALETGGPLPAGIVEGEALNGSVYNIVATAFGLAITIAQNERARCYRAKDHTGAATCTRIMKRLREEMRVFQSLDQGSHRSKTEEHL